MKTIKNFSQNLTRENFKTVFEEICGRVKIAFFDLDKTLTDEDTDYLWSLWIAGREFRGLAEIIKLLSLNRRYRKGRLDADSYIKFQEFRFRGRDPESVKKLAGEFFRKRGVKHIAAESRWMFNLCREKGVKPVIITAQNELIAASFAAHLGAEGLIGNRLMEINGRFAGPRFPVVFEEGKVHYAREYAASMNSDLKECAFFSDSIHDLPLLIEAGEPFVINPDPRLMRIAEERGWPVYRC